MMKTICGDIIELAKSDQYDVLVHGCNCFNTMGAGVAQTVVAHFPEARDVDQATIMGDISKLGTLTVAYSESHRLFVVNAYTQFSYGRHKRHVQYEAVETCFRQIRERFGDKSIIYPKIGAGLGGGSWMTIAQIIDRELDGCDHTCAILPGT